jgi:hypothetical protein
MTGPLLDMTEIGAILFLIALLTTLLFRRIAAATGLIAAVLCLPLFLYFIAPGPYRWLFGGEYSVPMSADFVWDTWAVTGILVVAIAAYFSSRASFSCDARKQKPVSAVYTV